MIGPEATTPHIMLPGQQMLLPCDDSKSDGDNVNNTAAAAVSQKKSDAGARLRLNAQLAKYRQWKTMSSTATLQLNAQQFIARSSCTSKTSRSTDTCVDDFGMAVNNRHDDNAIFKTYNDHNGNNTCKQDGDGDYSSNIKNFVDMTRTKDDTDNNNEQIDDETEANEKASFHHSTCNSSNNDMPSSPWSRLAFIPPSSKLIPHPKPTDAKFPPGCPVSLHNYEHPKHKRINPTCTVTSISVEVIVVQQEQEQDIESSSSSSEDLCITAAYYDLVDENNHVYHRVPQAFLEFQVSCPVLVLYEGFWVDGLVMKCTREAGDGPNWSGNLYYYTVKVLERGSGSGINNSAGGVMVHTAQMHVRFQPPPLLPKKAKCTRINIDMKAPNVRKRSPSVVPPPSEKLGESLAVGEDIVKELNETNVLENKYHRSSRATSTPSAPQRFGLHVSRQVSRDSFNAAAVDDDAKLLVNSSVITPIRNNPDDGTATYESAFKGDATGSGMIDEESGSLRSSSPAIRMDIDDDNENDAITCNINRDGVVCSCVEDAGRAVFTLTEDVPDGAISNKYSSEADEASCETAFNNYETCADATVCEDFALADVTDGVSSNKSSSEADEASCETFATDNETCVNAIIDAEKKEVGSDISGDIISKEDSKKYKLLLSHGDINDDSFEVATTNVALFSGNAELYFVMNAFVSNIHFFTSRAFASDNDINIVFHNAIVNCIGCLMTVSALDLDEGSTCTFDKWSDVLNEDGSVGVSVQDKKSSIFSLFIPKQYHLHPLLCSNRSLKDVNKYSGLIYVCEESEFRLSLSKMPDTAIKYLAIIGFEDMMREIMANYQSFSSSDGDIEISLPSWFAAATITQYLDDASVMNVVHDICKEDLVNISCSTKRPHFSLSKKFPHSNACGAEARLKHALIESVGENSTFRWMLAEYWSKRAYELTNRISFPRCLLSHHRFLSACDHMRSMITNAKFTVEGEILSLHQALVFYGCSAFMDDDCHSIVLRGNCPKNLDVVSLMLTNVFNDGCLELFSRVKNPASESRPFDIVLSQQPKNGETASTNQKNYENDPSGVEDVELFEQPEERVAPSSSTGVVEPIEPLPNKTKNGSDHSEGNAKDEIAPPANEVNAVSSPRIEFCEKHSLAKCDIPLIDKNHDAIDICGGWIDVLKQDGIHEKIRGDHDNLGRTNAAIIKNRAPIVGNKEAETENHTGWEKSIIVKHHLKRKITDSGTANEEENRSPFLLHKRAHANVYYPPLKKKKLRIPFLVNNAYAAEYHKKKNQVNLSWSDINPLHSAKTTIEPVFGESSINLFMEKARGSISLLVNRNSESLLNILPDLVAQHRIGSLAIVTVPDKDEGARFNGWLKVLHLSKSIAVSVSPHSSNKSPFYVFFIPKRSHLFRTLIKSATVKDVDHCNLDCPGLMCVLEISTVLSRLSKGDFREKALSCMNSIRKCAVSFQSSFLPLNDCVSMKISLPSWLTYGIATGCLVNKNVREFVLFQHKEGKVQIFSQMTKPHFTITRCTTDDSFTLERVTNELKQILVESVVDESIRYTLEEYWKDHNYFMFRERILVTKQESLQKVRGLLKMLMRNPRENFWLDRFMKENSCSVFIAENCEHIFVRGNDEYKVKKATSSLEKKLRDLRNFLFSAC